MESLAIAKSTKDNQGVTGSAATTKTDDKTNSSDDFSTLVNSLLSPDAEKNVSEEALFAALTVQRVTALKGKEIGKKFEDLLKSTEKGMTSGNGHVAYEDAARVALKQMQTTGDLTGEEADKVNSEAFDAAQLDTNLNSLYDDIGGKGDITKAVAAVEAAVAGAKAIIEKIEAGTEKPTLRSLAAAFNAQGKPIGNPYETGAAIGTVLGKGGPLVTGLVTPKGTNMDGANGFLWKPKSDHGGKLAILIPNTETVHADSVVLKDANGATIENGFYWTGFVPEPNMGTGPGRRKFSFTKPGGSYPQGLTVEVTYSNGQTAQYKIPDPSKRYD